MVHQIRLTDQGPNNGVTTPAISVLGPVGQAGKKIGDPQAEKKNSDVGSNRDKHVPSFCLIRDAAVQPIHLGAQGAVEVSTR